MTALTGPALLRAAAGMLNAGTMDRCANCDHLVSMHSEGGCWYTLTAGVVGENLACLCQATSPPVAPSIVPDLAAWLLTFSIDAETAGWVTADGAFKLGAPTSYPTAISREVVGE